MRVLCVPVILHLNLQVVANLEVLPVFAELALHKLLEDILEMHTIGLTLINVNLVSCQDAQDLFVSDNNTLFLMDVEGLWVQYSSPFLYEFFGIKLAVIVEFLVAERRRHLNYQLNEVDDLDPASGFRVVLLPGLQQNIDIVRLEYTHIDCG